VLSVQHLSKSYGAATVLADVSFAVNPSERVGLIGPNGSGKSTLLRCLIGQEQPDAGTVVANGARLGYLAQVLSTPAPADSDLVYDSEARTVDDVLGAAGPGYRSEIAALALDRLDPRTPIHRLSGGQKTRLGLAAALLDEPDVLVLDEPTNHLDVEALDWLEQFIVYRFNGAVLVVSHDRSFLDATVDRILYLDPETRSLRAYRGGYADFAAARAGERDQELDAWQRQEKYVARVKGDIGRLKSEARSVENSTTARQPGLRKFARKKAAVARSRERKLERYLASDEYVERPKLRWPIKLDFGPPPPGGRAMVHLDHVSFAYPGQDAPLLEDVSFEVRYGQRVALVGPNGAGKTTLLRLIAGDLQPASGTLARAPAARLGVMAQEQETLDSSLTVLQTVLRERAMSEQDARDFLPAFLFYGDAVFKPVAACSLGERSRLQLARLVLQGCNLLLLDEPINHLDVESREHFEAALDAFDGTVIVVAHDRAFLRSFARVTLEVGGGRVNPMTRN
jgi:ATP-binding cassette subfamily F protein 3